MPDIKSDHYDKWLGDDGPVALVIRQHLVPAAQPDDIIFPPSYANPSEKEGDPPVYNIDGEGADSVCVIDSIPSQANRLEPTFAREPFKALVPQTKIKFKDGLERSILDIGHRLADAAFRGTEQSESIKEAFKAFGDGDATKIARLAPTSLVFGAWDSRETGVKIPRLINSIIRARNVVQIKRSAQYFPPINYQSEDLLPEDLKGRPSEFGLAEAPSVHKIGGVQIKGSITRDASLNLVALRCLRAGASAGDIKKLRRYILGLCLVAMAAEPDLNLRQGCLLTLDPEKGPTSELVERSGRRSPQQVTPADAAAFAKVAAEDFVVGPDQTFDFDPKVFKESLDEKQAKKKAKNRGASSGAVAAGPSKDGQAEATP